jgi:hypothetical protein
MGRVLDGDPMWTTFIIPTPGASNDPSTCPWDLDDNGSVGIADLLVIIDLWGKCVCVADFDQDGRVAIPDLLAVIDHWGDCPKDG